MTLKFGNRAADEWGTHKIDFRFWHVEISALRHWAEGDRQKDAPFRSRPSMARID
jgi:hypothetical protein